MNLTQMQAQQERMTNSLAYQRGNLAKFGPENVSYDPQSPLNGKRIGYLGSSITYGFAAKGVSFVDYLQARDGVITTKSAISGTTLAGKGEDNYLYRLKHHFSGDYDFFVCQLSTNDGRQGKKLGKITPDKQHRDFDVETTIGAIEEVCTYVHDQLHSPLAFYTCLRDDPDGSYAALIKQLRVLQDKWGFSIIDLFHNEGLKASLAAHPNAMFDDAHPTQEGYLKVWFPIFERALTNLIG